jgi:hypothetical protein
MQTLQIESVCICTTISFQESTLLGYDASVSGSCILKDCGSVKMLAVTYRVVQCPVTEEWFPLLHSCDNIKTRKITVLNL